MSKIDHPDLDKPLEYGDRERAHGEYETVRAYADEFITMDQIRGEKNVVKSELKESIAKTGLLNPIDAVLLDKELFSEYITFTNQAWGAEAKLVDFNRQRTAEGYYCLVIAGHSRHNAITELEDEGVLARRQILAKKHIVDSVSDIIEIQLAENIHSQPPKERQAIAVVEAYMYGLSTGQWQSPEDFIQKNADNGVTLTGLRKALHFARLPNDIRNFVLSGIVPYSAGVELGATVLTLRRYLAIKNGFSDESDDRIDHDLLQQVMREELIIKIDKITELHLNSTASVKMIEGWRKTMADATRKMLGDNTALFDFELASPDEQLRASQRDARRQLTQLVTDIAKMPASKVDALIRLHGTVLPDDVINRCRATLSVHVSRRLHELGGNAVDASGIDSTLFK